MTASLIYDRAPIGALISWTDGTPRPPRCAGSVHSEWLFHNDRGRLVGKEGKRGRGEPGTSPAITILKGEFAEAGVVANSSIYTFYLSYPLRFAVVERPPIGSVRVFDRPGRDARLIYLASSHAEAEHWVKVEGHRYPDAVLEEVTADEIAADHVEGRTAA